MPSKDTFAAHPRLLHTAEAIERLTTPAEIPFLQGAEARLKTVAARFRKEGKPVYDETHHNAHLVRARLQQSHVLTFLVRYAQTGRPAYREAVLERIRQMHDWTYWSWIAWREGNKAPDAIFDLSYGENAATLAIAYDWLHAELSPAERDLFLETARSRPFAAGLKHAKKGAAGWYANPHTNWNSVCSGGLGMLCLAMYEDAKEARALLPRAEESMAPFMKALEASDGGWPEGVGYWNYGMRYAFQYLLSHEQATGRKHPRLRASATRKTLSFPLLFCPHGQACSFGDVNRWTPLPFHYAAAHRLGETNVVQALDALLDDGPGRYPLHWPLDAGWLLLHPRTRTSPVSKKTKSAPLAHRFNGLDWVALADRWPNPTLYAGVRGGTTCGPHTHDDLTSFHCVVGDERLITDVKPGEYLDTTFSARRRDLFEMNPVSKNVALLNGVGIERGSSLEKTELLETAYGPLVRLVATKAMGKTYRDEEAARFFGRVIALFEGDGLLVIDRVVPRSYARLEQRFHTQGTVRAGQTYATLRGERQRLRLTCAATVPARITTATAAPTTPPDTPFTQIRWCSNGLFGEMVFGTLLTPGARATKLEVEPDGKHLLARATIRGKKRTLRFSPSLKPVP